MAFKPRTWVNRHVQFPLRREYTLISDNIYDVKRAEGNITAEGDKFNAENMNDLEQRIDTAFKDANTEIDKKADITYVNDNFANALKGNASGSVISVDDVSPIQHNVGCKVESKNLIVYPYKDSTITKNGITVTVNNDGTLTVNGTTTETVVFLFNVFKHTKSLPKGTYTLSKFDTHNGTKDKIDIISNYHNEYYAFESKAEPITFVVDDNSFLIDQIRFVSYAGATYSNTVIKPMLEVGSTPTPYTPYVDVSNTNVNVCGNNIISTDLWNGKSNIVETYPLGFIVKSTYQESDYGSVGSNYFELSANEIYKLSFDVKLNDDTSNVENDKLQLLLDIRNNDASWKFTKSLYVDKIDTFKHMEFTFTPTKSPIRMRIQAWFGDETRITTVKNLILTKSDIVINQYTPLADGTVNGIKSISPNMTITSDTDGVNIECEYNRDINKAFEKLTNTIISLGGNV